MRLRAAWSAKWKSLNHVQLCNAMDYGPSGSSVYGILQSRMLEWVVIVFSSNLELNLHFWQHLFLYCQQLWAYQNHLPSCSPPLDKTTSDVPFLLICTYFLSVSSVQSLSHVWLFVAPWTAACQDSLSITNSQSPPKAMSIVSVMPSNHLILCHPLFLLPSIFPSIGVFSNESALLIRWPSIGVSA